MNRLTLRGLGDAPDPENEALRRSRAGDLGMARLAADLREIEGRRTAARALPYVVRSGALSTVRRAAVRLDRRAVLLIERRPWTLLALFLAAALLVGGLDQAAARQNVPENPPYAR